MHILRAVKFDHCLSSTALTGESVSEVQRRGTRTSATLRIKSLQSLPRPVCHVRLVDVTVQVYDPASDLAQRDGGSTVQIGLRALNQAAAAVEFLNLPQYYLNVGNPGVAALRTCYSWSFWRSRGKGLSITFIEQYEDKHHDSQRM